MYCMKIVFFCMYTQAQIELASFHLIIHLAHSESERDLPQIIYQASIMNYTDIITT